MSSSKANVMYYPSDRYEIDKNINLSHSASYYAAFTPHQGKNFRRTLFHQTVKETSAVREK